MSSKGGGSARLQPISRSGGIFDLKLEEFQDVRIDVTPLMTAAQFRG